MASDFTVAWHYLLVLLGNRVVKFGFWL
jgi:hypothetical protein